MGGAQALAQAEAAPPFASKERKRWNMSTRPAGPVALLLQSLGGAGLTMDADIRVWGPFGSIQLATAPMHLFRSVIMEAAPNGTIRGLATRRPQLAPAQGIDWDLTRPLWDGDAAGANPDSSQRHLLALAAGGHWRQHRIKAMEPTEAAICILCGQGRDDDEHLWRCPALRHIHEKHSMVSRCRSYMPVQLRLYGIAPYVCTGPQKAFWGGSPDTLSRHERIWIGMGVGEQHLTHADQRKLISQGETIYNLMLHHAPYDPLPLHGWYHAPHEDEAKDPGDVEGQPDTSEPGDMVREGRDAPQDPTVFTDGSVRPARPAWLTTAGIGAYWPRSSSPIAEADWIAYWGDDEGTLKAATHSADCRTAKCVPLAARQSSTRVEAQGVLVAAAHPGPQCIATDNIGTVTRWSQLLHAVKYDTLPLLLRRRPWGLRPDGDVWEAAAHLIARKGPDSIRVIWTKGHATDDDIREGKSCEEHRKGNEVADLLAGAAHELQPSDKAMAGRLAITRWTAAQRVVKAVHAFLREAIVERENLRQQKRRATSKKAGDCHRDAQQEQSEEGQSKHSARGH